MIIKCWSVNDFFSVPFTYFPPFFNPYRFLQVISKVFFFVTLSNPYQSLSILSNLCPFLPFFIVIFTLKKILLPLSNNYKLLLILINHYQSFPKRPNSYRSLTILLPIFFNPSLFSTHIYQRKELFIYR